MIVVETPAEGTPNDSVPPSVDTISLLAGRSYSTYSPCPPNILATRTSDVLSGEGSAGTPCVLGVDEAGRGPVLGPMVYSAFYIPQDLERSLLTQDHCFDDSKVLTPGVRSNLVRLLCQTNHALFNSCGWAVRVLSARDISAGMMRPGMGVYNLNAQAMDATIELIRGIVEERQINIKEVYIDTIGNPITYQQKLERIFPSLKITVAKKADSLFPCVSAASVVAKVTRDVGLEACYAGLLTACQSTQEEDSSTLSTRDGWGSGYPSDSKCVDWLRRDMHDVFGWGNECRFSWGTVKEMLEAKRATKVDWPGEEDEVLGLESFLPGSTRRTVLGNELSRWYGNKVGEDFLL